MVNISGHGFGGYPDLCTELPPSLYALHLDIFSLLLYNIHDAFLGTTYLGLRATSGSPVSSLLQMLPRRTLG